MSGPLLPLDVAASRYEHGTRARYVLAKCRCFPCKVANADYVHEQTRAKRNVWRLHYAQEAGHYVVRNSETGEVRMRAKDKAIAVRCKDALNAKIPSECDGEWIDAKRARNHIARLQRAGIGYKTIARRAGLSPRTVFEILKKRVTRSKRATVEAILGVSGAPVGSTLIDAGPTWILLDALIAVGYSKAWLAREMGAKARGLQIERKTCAAFTAERVKALYDRIWATDERLRMHVDPYGERNRIAEAQRAAERAEHEPQSVPLSKRDPAIKKRWDDLFRATA